jgi:Fungal Zn(2)-Cys(6) binuclear cluster domain
MSYQPPESSSYGAEPLKIWNCTNCRRRKVRCDRRHPCAPCTRNKTECVFPVSGRVPHRSRDGNYPRPPVQNQVELAGRLRRLEAMVGGLSSQVESAALANHGNHSLESSANGASTASSESGWLGLGLVNRTSESSHASEDSDMLQVASNGDLVVGKGFWTVFCKEVGANSGLSFLQSQESSETFAPGCVKYLSR